jgi:MYXO-CTERM domain-containing protein
MKNRVMAGVVALCASAGAAQAAVIFDINTEYSGAFQAAGYVQLKFEQTGSDVRMTVTSFLQGSEFLSTLAFNVDPFSTLTYEYQAGSSSGTFALPTITQGLNHYHAAGDGLYDVRFSFATAQADRFDGSDVAVFLIENATESWFDAWSAPGGGAGPFQAVAHIQGIGPTGANSGWHRPGDTVIPLPNVAGLGLAGLGMIAVRRHRRA